MSKLSKVLLCVVLILVVIFISGIVGAEEEYFINEEEMRVEFNNTVRIEEKIPESEEILSEKKLSEDYFFEFNFLTISEDLLSLDRPLQLNLFSSYSEG